MDIEINREDIEQPEEAQTESTEQAASGEVKSEAADAQDVSSTKDLTKEYEAAKKRQDELENQLARARADFENFRRRNANGRSEGYDEGNSDCLKAILPVLDNFERAISVAENNVDGESLLNGVKMIQKQLFDALGKRGLETVNPVGEKFDPNEHNAVLRVSADEAEGEPGTICAVLQTGYRVKGKMLRHPMVKVIED